MREKFVLTILTLVLLSSCSNDGERVISNYLKACNDNDTVVLNKIIAEGFKLTYPDTTYNRNQYKENFKNGSLLFSQSKLIDCETINDSIYVTTEENSNIFQRIINIPSYKRCKHYCIKDGSIEWIKVDTLMGTNETDMILRYVGREFSIWLISNGSKYNDLETNEASFELITSDFVKSSKIRENIDRKIFRIDKYVELLKNTKYQERGIDLTFEKAFKQIAGLEGTVTWISYTTSKYVNNPNIRDVEVLINRNKNESKYNVIKMQYLVNIQNDYVELKYGEVNGNPQSIFDLSMTISLLLSSGSYI